MPQQRFIIMYEDLYYTTEPPVWGPTFTPNKEKAQKFSSESEARKKADTLTTFRLAVVPV